MESKNKRMRIISYADDLVVSGWFDYDEVEE